MRAGQISQVGEGRVWQAQGATDECAFGIDFNSLFGILLLNWALKPRTLKVT